jgi:hypothetical protein
VLPMRRTACSPCPRSGRRPWRRRRWRCDRSRGPPHSALGSTRRAQPLLFELDAVGRCRGNGCPAQQPRTCPVGRTGFGSPGPWPVAVTDGRLSVLRCGLVGSSHHAILRSRACHTFPSPRLETLGASFRSRWLLPRAGDVLQRILPPRNHFGTELVCPDPPAQVRQFRLHPLPTYGTNSCSLSVRHPPGSE